MVRPGGISSEISYLGNCIYCSNVSYFGIISFAVFMDFKWDVDELHDLKIFHFLLKYDSVENLNMRKILSSGISVVFYNLAKF